MPGDETGTFDHAVEIEADSSVEATARAVLDHDAWEPIDAIKLA